MFTTKFKDTKESSVSRNNRKSTHISKNQRKTTNPQLQLKKRTKQPRKVYIFSWDGLEHKKAKLQQLAREIVEKHKTLDKICKEKGWSLPGMVMNYMRDPSSVSYCLEAVEVGQLHVALRDLVHELVWTHNLDFDFVRREQAIILDPTQLQRCDDLIEHNKKKQRLIE